MTPRQEDYGLPLHMQRALDALEKKAAAKKAKKKKRKAKTC